MQLKQLSLNQHQTFSHLMILGIIGILVSTCLSIYTLLGFIKDDGRAINVAGLQRMISQNLAGEALLLAQGHGSIQNMSSLQSQFETALKGLAHGDQSLGLSSTKNDKVLKAIAAVETLWQAYIPLLEKVAHGERLTEQEIELFKNHKSQMLLATNFVVSEFEKESKKNVYNLKFLVLVSTALTLCLFGIAMTSRENQFVASFYTLCKALLFNRLKLEEPIGKSPLQPAVNPQESQGKACEQMTQPVMDVVRLSDSLNQVVLAPELIQEFKKVFDYQGNPSATDLYKLKLLHDQAMALTHRANQLNNDLKAFRSQFNYHVDRLGEK